MTNTERIKVLLDQAYFISQDAQTLLSLTRSEAQEVRLLRSAVVDMAGRLEAYGRNVKEIAEDIQKQE